MADARPLLNPLWPSREPIFEWDVPIDDRMFWIATTLHVVKVRAVTSHGFDGWTVQIDILADHTSQLTLRIETSLLTMYAKPEQVAQHVLAAVRDHVVQPAAGGLPGTLDIR